MRNRISQFVFAFFAASLLCRDLLCLAAPPSTAPSAKKVPYAQYVHAQINTILNTLQADNNYPAAIDSLQSLFDQTIRYAPDERVDSIHDADFALRLVTQLNDVDPSLRDKLLPFMRKQDKLAETLVFLVRGDEQKSAGIYRVLDKLRLARGGQLDSYATLTAAICVVQDGSFSREINENRVQSADPVDIFDYYVKNESRMYFGIKNVPAELLIYVVDTTASIADLEWSLNQYAGDSDVGKLFFTIKYDYEYLKRGTDKKVTVMGYNLPNILKYGGVCADQAYFATSVGKAIGVPTAFDTGESAEASHAWVGFLQYNGKHAGWNFDSGRYEAFQGVRGTVLDPQLRKSIPDSYVSLLGEIIGTRAIDRQTAVALTDAANRLGELRDSPADISAPPVNSIISSSIRSKPRSIDPAAELSMIDLALHQSIAYAPAWFVVRDLALQRKLSLSDKQHWSDLLLRLGAQKYPDFTLAMLMPMVRTIEDPQMQDALLTKMLPLFQTRSDLSASILMAQAALWERQKQTDRAGQCYMTVVERYTNSGPFVINALKGAEKLLQDSNRGEQIPLLYSQAWSRTTKPSEMAAEFMDQSNWFKIGQLYASKLNDSGNSAKAAEVNSKLGIAP